MTTATQTPAAPKWDLDSIFQGGSASTEFKQFRGDVKNELMRAATSLASLPKTLDPANSVAWTEFVLSLQSLYENTELIVSFSHCLVSENVTDNEAQAQHSESDTYVSDVLKLKSGFEQFALAQNDADWEKFVSSEKLKSVKFFLDEVRHLAKQKLPLEQESLVLELSVNGYHAWNRLYDKMAGELKAEFVEDDSVSTLSIGQLASKMSDPKRDIRKQAFDKTTEAWESRADLAAMTLNSLAGFRLSMYKSRKWKSVVYEPLTLARLEEKSLDAMWRVISRESARLKPYIEAKKKLLKIDKFSWWDEFAPCGAANKSYSYDDASKFIINNVGGFSPHFSDYCRTAIERRWIEAEDRPNKAGGGYCTGLGPRKESRIFMTYAGNYENLLTLAHELGHAYHSYVLNNHQYFATQYPMTLAETASIFSEMLVTDAALEASENKDEKLMLLDQKIQQAYVFFCNLQSRYLFERSFYEERSAGIVGRDRLCELMIAAQKKAYGDLLDPSGYHPYFWCSKLHFYISDVPFYNFPYTFGFLFAGGVYDRAKKGGRTFAEKYQALLADTGSMTTEEVAQKHLGVDLTSDSFWTDAVNRSLADIPQFVELASE
ncbi:MAG: M3 family oligoendopeptidase [candidate division Zixibacteria bacterium]|nr:M3 family oligoendopeptidase [candidate division Zixibacteria bacterium]